MNMSKEQMYKAINSISSICYGNAINIVEDISAQLSMEIDEYFAYGDFPTPESLFMHCIGLDREYYLDGQGLNENKTIQLERNKEGIDALNARGIDFDPQGPDCIECEYCGEWLQYMDDHDCYGTRGECYDAMRMERGY